MELSTILWIIGVIASFVIGNRNCGKMLRTKLSKTEKELNSAQNEIEQLKIQLAKKDTSNTIKPKSSISAKEAFLSNIRIFIPLLNTLSDGSYNDADWTEKIVDVNNDELTKYWRAACKSVNTWVRLLASWGISKENCSEFKCIASYKDRYKLKDGSEIIIGQKYTVISKCWTLTKEVNGKTRTEVILKGVVE